ncbi:peptidase S8/S53 domain-containing protein [Ochromonadaceae sp. CCMP2298]|nr:peptidase S8/S53 domain-containing protein [Ochromonadaceae sp. CCMP2298]
MIWFFCWLLATLVGVGCVGSTDTDDAQRVQMEPSITIFSSPMWIRERIDPKRMIQIVIVMKHERSRVARFEADLLELATPHSKRYGKWLKADDVRSMLAPSAANISVVTDFLYAHIPTPGIRISRLGDLITLSLTVEQAEDVLHTKFALFRSSVRREVALARVTGPYFLPGNVAAVVRVVDVVRLPTVRTDTARTRGRGGQAGSGGGGGSWDREGRKDRRGSGGSGDSGGRGTGDRESTGGGYRRIKASDQEFSAGLVTPAVLRAAYGFSELQIYSPGNSMAVASFHNLGEPGNSEPRNQELLDVQYINAVAHPIPLLLLQATTLLTWIDTLLDLGKPPLVHSVTYGYDEEGQVSGEYMEAVNEQFMVAGAMGLTLVFSAGGGGCGGSSGSGNGRNGCDSSGGSGGTGSGYRSSFPASSPYVTAAGGAAAGTAVAAVVAGMVAQLNDMRLARHMPPLGWLSPLLYANQGCFRVIKESRGGGGGYRAVEGWDSVTGLGTPDYQCLLKAVMSGK